MNNNYFKFSQLKKSMETRRRGDFTGLSIRNELQINNLSTLRSPPNYLRPPPKSGDTIELLQILSFKRVAPKMNRLSPCLHVSIDNLYIEKVRDNEHYSRLENLMPLNNCFNSRGTEE
jgi:hypothetical protein